MGKASAACAHSSGSSWRLGYAAEPPVKSHQQLGRPGIPDSNIILMLADDIACNARNSQPSAVFNNKAKGLNLYGSLVEVDYRGYDVTVENFIRVLTGRHVPAVPHSKRLMSDATSNVLVFLTGHGGDEFMKFQDDEELGAQDLANALAQMHRKGRYNELMLVVETCEASTMWRRVYSPRILGLASSALGEKSYSHHASSELGVSVIDRFTFHFLTFVEKYVPGIHSHALLQDLFDFVRAKPLHSTAVMKGDSDVSQQNRDAHVVDFLGSKHRARPVLQVHPFTRARSVHSPRDSAPGTAHNDGSVHPSDRSAFSPEQPALCATLAGYLWQLAAACCLGLIGCGVLIQPDFSALHDRQTRQAAAR
mmetsp:Transcript_1849/g.4824  ORF Transcript_1849/g.4824 Transcript_1849/m.4824 type:complete len:365 (-) Transcript_1849:629-1723(-)